MISFVSRKNSQITVKLEVREEELRPSSGIGVKGDEDSKAFTSGCSYKCVKKGEKNRNNKSHYCGKQGHIRRDCFLNPASENFKQELKGTQEKESSSGSKSRVQANIVFMVVSGTNTDPIGEFSRKWLVESCASKHICKYRSYFQDLMEVFSTVDITMEGDGGMGSK